MASIGGCTANSLNSLLPVLYSSNLRSALAELDLKNGRFISKIKGFKYIFLPLEDDSESLVLLPGARPLPELQPTKLKKFSKYIILLVRDGYLVMMVLSGRSTSIQEPTPWPFVAQSDPCLRITKL